MKHLKLLLALCTIVLLSACEDPENATLYLSITPSKTVNIGDNITLDASASIYDSISWELDKKLYGPCMTAGTCTISFGSPGNHTMRIEVRKEHTPDWTGSTRKGESHDSTQVTLIFESGTTNSSQRLSNMPE